MNSMLWTIFIFIFLPGLSEAKPRSSSSGEAAHPSVSSGPPLHTSGGRSSRELLPHTGSSRELLLVPAVVLLPRGGGSGELSTLDGHRCTWETSGDGLVTLLVQCTAGAGLEQHRYWCRYAGRPALCESYALRPSLYWKQLVGRLKKRHHACGGRHKLLRAKSCSKAPGEAHMKLASRGDGEEEEEERRGAGGGGQEKGGADGRMSETEEEEEEGRAGFVGDMEMSDMEPVQAYCAEGWNSVCSFFVRFFEG